MATISVQAGTGFPNIAALSSAQTGNGVSTNIADRCDSGVGDRAATTGTALLTITTTVGGGPTCTYAIEGSVDNSDWFAVAYADAATPETVTVATFVITTATTVRKILRPWHPWRFLRITYSLNTNVTNTASLAVF